MSRRAHWLILAGLVAALWIIYLAPWPVPWWVDGPLKPTLVAIAFPLLAQRLRVASWPVVLAFAVSFFLASVLELYLGGDGEHPDARVFMTVVGSLVFSPISLWGPVAFGALAFYFARRWWPDR